MVVSEWRVRDESNLRAEEYAMGAYEMEPGLFALKIHHGEAFTEWPDRRYVNGKVSYVDYVDIDLFSVLELDGMMLDLGYKEGQRMYYHFLPPNGNLDLDLHALSTDDDIRALHKLVALQRLFKVDIYIEHGFTNLNNPYDTPPRKRSGVVIEELSDNSDQGDLVVVSSANRRRSARLMLDWQSTDNVVENNEPKNNLNDITFDDVHIVGNEDNLGNEELGNAVGTGKAVDKGKGKAIEHEDSGESDTDRESDTSGDEDSEDSDYIVDPDNEIEEYEVDMRDFHMHIDPQVEYMGPSKEATVIPDENLENLGEDEDLGVINNDDFSSGDDPGSDIETTKANYIRSLRKKHRADDNETFQLGQTFGTKEEVKELIKNHSVQTRRQLKMVKNDGFKACMREIIGLDGAFMKGPYPGVVLTAVGLDPNNGIYPVAYGIVEAETTLSWTWFLTCLGEDLDLSPQSNFTFISDRQKGIIPAIARLFPSAEHRYCLKHIHENMKSQWRGKAFKDCLWRAAIAPTVPQFQREMEALRRLNQQCFEWVSKIPPIHWARSHFTGRAKSDILLNNICEAFNARLLKARGSPIITAIDYIREYMMKRISVVIKMGINKCNGPLTLTATRLLEVSKKEASKYTVIWDGAVGFQVSGPWGDQCVVDVALRTCTCKRWELTGIPCQHAVAANNNMAVNSMQPGIIESWVHECYWLSTWKQVYSFKIGGTNGPNMWSRSQIPTTITPPVHHTPVGRPKKKRRRSFNEDSMVKVGSNNVRKLKTLTCSLCGNLGHNSRGCKGQGGDGSSATRENVQSQPTQSTQPNSQPTQSTQPQSQPTQPSQPQSQPSQSLPTSPGRMTKKRASRLSPLAGEGSAAKKKKVQK